MAGPKKSKKLRPMRTNSSIPEELLFSDVLARLPVKSLARFRCVCRSWRAGIADPAFVRRHRELSPPPCLLDVQATSSKTSFQRVHPRTMETELIHDFEEEEEARVTTRRIRPTHCDGLVAIATRTERVVVCNPATREVIALPLGSHNAELDVLDRHVPSVAIGYDQWRNRYVVARYFYRMYGVVSYNKITGKGLQDYDIGHEVFTLGQGKGWEATQDPPHAIGFQRPICTRRAFYWHSSRPKPILMRFGLKDRAFDVVSHPPIGWTVLDDMTELDGKLCYVHQLVGNVTSYQVWLADEEDELQWSLCCHIHLSIPLEIMAADGGELLAVNSYNYLYRYNMLKHAMASVVDLYKRSNGTQYDRNYLNYFVPYVETLVSPRACNY